MDLTTAVCLGVGKMSEVWAWEGGQVLKLFWAGIPWEYAAHEAGVTQAVGEAGLPVPVVGEVVEVHGRVGFTLQHIHGHTLLEQWLQNPTDTEPIARTLAQLHQRIHALPAPLAANLPRQREWLENNLRDATYLPDEEKAALLAVWQGLPDGAQLCHGDFHPANLLLNEAGEAVVIDWFTAVGGHPYGDIAQTGYLLTEAPLPPDIASALPLALRQTLHQQYLHHYFAPHATTAWQTELIPWQQLARTANRITD
jgi:aminoglycoside phosphotransferase (APT) family kinase protein